MDQRRHPTAAPGGARGLRAGIRGVFRPGRWFCALNAPRMRLPGPVQETDAVGQGWERGPGEAGQPRGRAERRAVPTRPSLLPPPEFQVLASSGVKRPQGQGDRPEGTPLKLGLHSLPSQRRPPLSHTQPAVQVVSLLAFLLGSSWQRAGRPPSFASPKSGGNFCRNPAEGRGVG